MDVNDFSKGMFSEDSALDQAISDYYFSSSFVGWIKGSVIDVLENTIVNTSFPLF